VTRILLVIITGGLTLVGVILFLPKQDNRLPALVQQNKKAPITLQAPAPSLPTPTPIIIFVTVTPSPAPVATPVAIITPSPTPAIPIVSSPTPTPSIIPRVNRVFYTSSHWKAKYYYCDTDNDWENLSEKYLQTFSSERELLQNYDRILHEDCKN